MSLPQISVLPPVRETALIGPGNFGSTEIILNRNLVRTRFFWIWGRTGILQLLLANRKHVLQTGGSLLSPLCLRDKKDIKEGNRKRREGGRELWLYSEGIRNSERVLRDERESADKKDNRGESKVRAPVRLRSGRKKLLFLLPHSIRN